MKNSPIYLICFFLILSCAPKEKEAETPSTASSETNLNNAAMPDSVLRHVVLFGHAFTVTFHSDADRDAYIPHPAHQEFVGLLGPHLDKVTVIDYWTKE